MNILYEIRYVNKKLRVFETEITSETEQLIRYVNKLNIPSFIQKERLGKCDNGYVYTKDLKMGLCKVRKYFEGIAFESAYKLDESKEALRQIEEYIQLKRRYK